jgi:hypothetical protein
MTGKLASIACLMLTTLTAPSALADDHSAAYGSRINNGGMMAGGIVNVVIGDILVAAGAYTIASTPSGGSLSGLGYFAGTLIVVSGVGHLGIGVPLIAVGSRKVPLGVPPPTRRDNYGTLVSGIVLTAFGFVALGVGAALSSTGGSDLSAAGTLLWLSAIPHLSTGISLTAAGSGGAPQTHRATASTTALQLNAAPGGGGLTLAF